MRLEHPLYQPLVEELTVTIAQHRDAYQAEAIAKQVLERDTHSARLLGMIDGCQRYVVYDATQYAVNAYPVDENESDGVRGGRVERIGQRTALPKWLIDQGRDYWDWLHPKVRWVFRHT